MIVSSSFTRVGLVLGVGVAVLLAVSLVRCLLAT
jgi:hypothetical protein